MLRRDYGIVDKTEAVARVRSLFHGLRTDSLLDQGLDARSKVVRAFQAGIALA